MLQFKVVDAGDEGERRYVRPVYQQTCLEVIQAAIGDSVQVLNTDEWQGYARVPAPFNVTHATVCHGRSGTGTREWARDDDGDGIREVHSNGGESAGTALRTFLCGFRGVHKKYLADYVATFETITNAKQITPEIIQRMCFTETFPQSKDT